MMNKFKIVSGLEEISIESWNNLFEQSVNSCVFQSSDMYFFWETQVNSKPYIFGVYDEDDVLICTCLIVIVSNGSCLKKYLSRRGIIYGGPIFRKDAECDKVFRFLLKEIDNSLKDASIYTEFRNLFDYSYIQSVFKEDKWEYIPYQNYKISLSSNEDVFKSFSSEKRRQIRKSLREGVSISYEKTEENLLSIYRILTDIYKNRVKKPLPSFAFFESLMQMNGSGLAAIIYQGEVIGGALFIYDKDCIYDWYRGGDDINFKKQFPSTVAAWAVIENGLNNVIPNFDFMGAGIKGESYGVQKFKSQFGGLLVEHGRYLKIYNPVLFSLGKIALKLKEKIA